MTVIEIRPFRNGWQVYEAAGVQPVFLNQEQAINHATGRACFRSGEIRILDSTGNVERVIPFNETIESCDSVIRVYDEAGNVIETYKHAGDFRG